MLGHGRRRQSAKAEKPLRKTEDKIRCAREDALNASECEELLSGCRSLLDNLVVRIPLYTDMRVGEITHLRQFIRALQQEDKWSDHPYHKSQSRKLSPHTIESYIRHIRAFWSWLKREEFIDDNPLPRVRTPKAPRKAVPTLTPQQVEQLLRAIPCKNHAGHRDFAIVLTLYGTGLRISELLNLRLEDVNLDSGQVKVMGKGGRERMVFLSPVVYKAVYKYRWRWRPKAASDYFFVTDDGRRLGLSYIEHRMRDYGRKAGITGVRCSPHTLRHSFAVNYLRASGDTFTLQKVLGHSSLIMTRHYAELSDADVEAKQKTFSPTEKLGLRV